MSEKRTDSPTGMQKDSVAESTANAPTATVPANETLRRILGLEEGWELAPAGATFTASQTPDEVILKASGEHPTGGYETKLVMSPLRIYPPQWMLAIKKPTGPATQAFTPFEATASFKAKEKIETIQVSDIDGRHTVVVDQARD